MKSHNLIVKFKSKEPTIKNQHSASALRLTIVSAINPSRPIMRRALSRPSFRSRRNNLAGRRGELKRMRGSKSLKQQRAPASAVRENSRRHKNAEGRKKIACCVYIYGTRKHNILRSVVVKLKLLHC